MKNVMVTGATGFIGQHLCQLLHSENKLSVAVVRDRRKLLPNLQRYVVEVPSLSSSSIANSLCFTGIEVVIHLAALAHQPARGGADELISYRYSNTQLTIDLARAAVSAGVKRFIFLSSIGVNGTSTDKPFSETDLPNPREAYAISKYEAELGLHAISAETGLEVVVIRPPLVYGPGAPGNFARLIKLAASNFPLPLGSINNKRSLVSVTNLVSLLSCCVDHSKAAGATFLVSDNQDVSTSELLRGLIKAARAKTLLLPFPISLLKFFAKCLGKSALVERFSNTLQVDISHTCNTLEWSPVISLDDGLSRCFINEDLS